MSTLVGKEILRLKNMDYRKSKVTMPSGMGSLVVYEDGVAFFKSSGAMLGAMAFGLLGQALTSNNEQSEAMLELPYDRIRGARNVLIALEPGLEIQLTDGSTVYFMSRSRVFNGKADMQRAADCINQRIG